MAVRIRKNGKIVCAASSKEKAGDTYINDELHYTLSVKNKILVTQPMYLHKRNGEWWWKGNVPKNVKIDEFYKT